MPVTADDIFDGDWDGIAPQQRGCLRALAVQPSTKGYGIVSISVNPKTPTFGGSGKNKSNKGDVEEDKLELKSKLISNPTRSKSVPPALSWRTQRVKTVVVQEEPRHKNTKSTVTTVSDDTDALLGRRKLITKQNARDNYDDWIDSAYIPPQKDRFIWNQNSSSSPILARDSEKRFKERSFFDGKKDTSTKDMPISESSSKGYATSSTSRSNVNLNQHQPNQQTRHVVKERSFFDTKQDKGNKDIKSDSSSTDRATLKSNPILSNAISRWKSDVKDTQESHKRNASTTRMGRSKDLSTFQEPSMQHYEIKTKTADIHNRKTMDSQNNDELNLADLLSTNLKQMERDIEDLNRRKYFRETTTTPTTTTTRQSSQEQEYLLNKQKIQEQEEILLREQKLIPAEISLQPGLRDAYLQKDDDGDSVSELGTESVTPKLNTSGLTLVYTDRAKRSNYVNDIDDTVEIHDDAPYSSYHRGVGNHFNNRGGTRRDATPKIVDYGPTRRTKSKSLTRFDNRGLPDVSLIDSDSEVSARDLIEEDDLSYPLHRKGLSLTEAFNDFGLDDRISAVRKSQRLEEVTDILEEYENRRENMKVGRRVQNGYQSSSSSPPPSDSAGTPKSYQSTGITRLLASRALRSSKYVEAGGAIRLKRDQVTSPISNRRNMEEMPLPATRSSSTKRGGTLPKGSFPVMTKADYEPPPNEYSDLVSNKSSGFGTQRSRRMMRSL